MPVRMKAATSCQSSFKQLEELGLTKQEQNESHGKLGVLGDGCLVRRSRSSLPDFEKW